MKKAQGSGLRAWSKEGIRKSSPPGRGGGGFLSKHPSPNLRS